MSDPTPEWQRTEGRRLFDLCVQHGAIPGNVHKWLAERLEKLDTLERQVSNAGLESENYIQSAIDQVRSSCK